jgi:hypothetical protein
MALHARPLLALTCGDQVPPQSTIAVTNEYPDVYRENQGCNWFGEC